LFDVQSEMVRVVSGANLRGLSMAGRLFEKRLEILEYLAAFQLVSPPPCGWLVSNSAFL